jgi:chemotaxis protein CheD
MTGSSTFNSDGDWRRVGVGVGDVVVSQNARDLLTTNRPVGSCVAVYLWDPESRVGGVLHFEWPDSKSDPSRAQAEPAVFADTGVMLLLERAGLMGAAKGRCKVRLVGGADIRDRAESERWAKRNILAARSVLWRSGIFVDGEEVGGTKARKATLSVSDGQLSVVLDESTTA